MGGRVSIIKACTRYFKPLPGRVQAQVWRVPARLRRGAPNAELSPARAVARLAAERGPTRFSTPVTEA